MSTLTTTSTLLSAKEVGKIIGRHEKTVHDLAKRGLITYIKQEGSRQYQFLPDHVAEYLRSCEVPAGSAPRPAAKPLRNPKYAS